MNEIANKILLAADKYILEIHLHSIYIQRLRTIYQTKRKNTRK